VGFLDRAKKLAEQAMAEVKARTAQDDAATPAPSGSAAGSAPPPPPPPTSSGPSEMGTPYMPGMLGRPGWRERGLVDPAAILPIDDRDRVGVPHTVKSEIVETAFGMGRRWSTGDRSLGLFYQLYPEHEQWLPSGGTFTGAGVPGARVAKVAGGTDLVFLGEGDRRVVLEAKGFDETTRDALARVVTTQLASAG
jgi:hypothetical protein